MNIHLPAILMFTRGTRFWHTAICLQRQRYCETLILLIAVFVILLALIDLVPLWRCHEEVLGISPMLGDQTCWAYHMQGKWSCTAKSVQRNLHSIHSLEFGVWRQWMTWPIPAYSWWAKGGFAKWGTKGACFQMGCIQIQGPWLCVFKGVPLLEKKHISGQCWSKFLNYRTQSLSLLFLTCFFPLFGSCKLHFKRQCSI